MSNSNLLEISLDKIKLEDRARKEYDVEDLVESVREKGIIQPITVVNRGDYYKLLAGGRRFTAASEIGLATIPCLIRDPGDALEDKEIEFLENAERRDLKWQERMKLVIDIKQLQTEKHGKRGSQSRTARFLDRSVNGIARIVKLHDMCSMFPQLLECKNEDEAVRKARKLLEGAMVKVLEKKHREAIGDISEEEALESVTTKPLPGEGFAGDEYVNICRRAASHFRIGDAFDGLGEIITEGLTPPIQLVEIDPPYGIDLQTQKKGEKDFKLDRYEEVPSDQYKNFTEKLCDLVYETTPDDCRIIYWHGIEWYELVKTSLRASGFQTDPIPCIWSKRSGQTNSPEFYLARTYETFTVAWKGQGIPINSRGRSNVFEFSPVPAARKYHPTQKPIELMEEILKVFGWPGGIIMVPFLGSGVTLRAAYRQRMIPFGWELNENNKGKFLAAVEQDIEDYKVNNKIGDNEPHGDIPF